MRHFLLLTFTFIVNSGFAQSTNAVSTSLAKSNGPLYIVNGVIFGDNNTFQRLLNISDIENIEILKDSTSTALFCGRPDHNIVLVVLKNNVQVLSFVQLLNKFKIKKKYRQYPVYLDNQPIINVKDFYISSSKATDVKLEYLDNNVNKTPYLNIVTNQ